MKAVMIAVMTLAMAGFFASLLSSLDKYEIAGGITPPILVLWSLCFVLVIIGLCAFGHACELGMREDKLKESNDKLNAFKDSDVTACLPESLEIPKPTKWYHRIIPWLYLRS